MVRYRLGALCLACLLLGRLGACQQSSPQHHHLEVEENTDPRGEPGMDPCASTDSELEELYKTCKSPGWPDDGSLAAETCT